MVWEQEEVCNCGIYPGREATSFYCRTSGIALYMKGLAAGKLKRHDSEYRKLYFFICSIDNSGNSIGCIDCTTVFR